MPKLIILLALISITLSNITGATHTVSAKDGGHTIYGKTDGIAIDFDATYSHAADWNADLINGQSYSVNSISLFKSGSYSLHTGKVYLGVYKKIDSNKRLSGYLGTSINGFDLENSPNGKITWKFSDLNVIVDNLAGGGTGELLFILQTERGPIQSIGRQEIDRSPFKRFDGESGRYTNQLSAVITGNVKNALNVNRALEYEANLTPNTDSDAYSAIPEPAATIMLTGLFALGCALSRRDRATH